jgi:hypothetical protein
VSEHHDMQLSPDDRTALERAPRGLTAVGLGLGVVMLIAAALLTLAGGDWTRFMFAYTTAFAFWLSLSLGGLFFVLITHVAHTGATVVVRRLGELVAANMGVLAVLAVPILAAAWTGTVYEWADPAPDDKVVAGKALYLNLPFFTIRWLFYFAVWIGLGLFYLRTSRRQDETGDPDLTLKMQKMAPAGLLLFGLTLTFASFDLLKSLSPHWFSTMFGVYYFAGCVVGFYSVKALLMRWIQSKGVATDAIRASHYHDTGKMMFAFVVFWAYIAYSQFMLIWYATIPEETVWYIAHGATTREHDVTVWSYVLLVLLFGHFVLPFLGMINRDVKRRRNLLCAWAVWLLVMHYLDLLWLTRPSLAYHEHPLPITTIEVIQWPLCLLGMGGIWLGMLAKLAADKSLLPVKDPRLGESLAFENL